MKITKDVRYIGVNDRKIDLFEGQYAVPNGISYNSYLILDEKAAVMDTVDAHFADEWMENLKSALAGRKPDYLVVQHMEPDHSAGILQFAKAFPEAVIVSSAKAFPMMKNFFGEDFADRRLTVGDGDKLSLGKHTLQFVSAPMVHWPEVIVTFDECDGILFSADGFGKFGTPDTDEPWDDEARRYYIGIVAKFGASVGALLKKVSALSIRMICPLHGPVLCDDLAHYLALYSTWSTYTPETDGIVIAYASVYGNTKAACELLGKELREKGKTVVLYDLVRCDMSAAVADAFRYSHLVLASVTYNGDVFPPMKDFLDHLAGRAYQKRTVSYIENGSWAPTAAKVMRELLSGCKNLTETEHGVKLLSGVSEDAKEQLRALADELTGK